MLRSPSDRLRTTLWPPFWPHSALHVLTCSTALTVAACARDAPMAPHSPTVVASRSQEISAALPERSGVGEALADASSRLVPSVADAVARAQLDGYLRDLSAHLDAGDTDKALRALALARKALASRAEASEQADLAAIGLALDQVEAMLRSSTPPAQD